MAKKKSSKKDISPNNDPNFESHPLLTTPYPTWIEPLPVDRINARFMRIIQFYVLNSPCEHLSWGRKSMLDFGWEKYWNSSVFRAMIYNAAELNSFIHCVSWTDFKRQWSSTYNGNDQYFHSHEEFAYFIKANEESQLMDLFHHIRNAICHGRIRMNGDYIFFEDVHPDGQKVNARISLKMETMEKWMQIIKCETNESKQVWEDMRNNREKKNKNKNYSEVKRILVTV